MVDSEDTKFGGAKLLGFVMIQSVIPRKLASRRGDIEYDFEEGGPAPLMEVGNIRIGVNGDISAGSDEYVPPPHGKCCLWLWWSTYLYFIRIFNEFILTCKCYAMMFRWRKVHYRS